MIQIERQTLDGGWTCYARNICAIFVLLLTKLLYMFKGLSGLKQKLIYENASKVFMKKIRDHIESKEIIILESGMRWLMKLLASKLFSTIAKQTTLKLSNLKHQIVLSHTSCGLSIRARLSWGFWLKVLHEVAVRELLRGRDLIWSMPGVSSHSQPHSHACWQHSVLRGQLDQRPQLSTICWLETSLIFMSCRLLNREH